MASHILILLQSIYHNIEGFYVESNRVAPEDFRMLEELVGYESNDDMTPVRAKSLAKLYTWLNIYSVQTTDYPELKPSVGKWRVSLHVSPLQLHNKTNPPVSSVYVITQKTIKPGKRKREEEVCAYCRDMSCYNLVGECPIDPITDRCKCCEESGRYDCVAGELVTECVQGGDCSYCGGV